MTEPEQGKSPDNPWPVRAVATRVAKYIDRLGAVWIEGQLTELKLRGSTAWMVLRDPAADMSLTVSCPRDLVTDAPVPLSEGTQVVVCAKPYFHTARGSFWLWVSEIRAVGVGELEELLAYEEATTARAPFQTLLANRITRATAK